MTDSELIENLRNHDGEAFRLMIEKYQQLVYKTCYALLNNREDSEDIAQEVFTEVYISIRNFRGDAKISTWLYRIAVNKSRNLIRKNRWQLITSRFGLLLSGEKAELSEVEDFSGNMAKNIEILEGQKIMWNAIEALPENQRIAFTLNKYDELSYQEIAEAMQTSVSAVESLIHRAKLNLQKRLQKYFSG